jgi:hypothetical protein
MTTPESCPRCAVCDRPKDECARSRVPVFGSLGVDVLAECSAHAVDWRARALAAEAAVVLWQGQTKDADQPFVAALTVSLDRVRDRIRGLALAAPDNAAKRGEDERSAGQATCTVCDGLAIHIDTAEDVDNEACCGGDDCCAAGRNGWTTRPLTPAPTQDFGALMNAPAGMSDAEWFARLAYLHRCNSSPNAAARYERAATALTPAPTQGAGWTDPDARPGPWCDAREPEHGDRCHKLPGDHEEHHNIATGRHWRRKEKA